MSVSSYEQWASELVGVIYFVIAQVSMSQPGQSPKLNLMILTF